MKEFNSGRKERTAVVGSGDTGREWLKNKVEKLLAFRTSQIWNLMHYHRGRPPQTVLLYSSTGSQEHTVHYLYWTHWETGSWIDMLRELYGGAFKLKIRQVQ